jgi:hypothetical protein
MEEGKPRTPMESRLNNTRSILAAVLIAALATAAHAAEHGESRPAAHSGDGGAHETAGPGGRAGAGAHGIDPVRTDGGAGNLRRRAMRSSLIAKAPTKNPTILPTASTAVHPTIPGMAGEVPRNAIGATTPTSLGARDLGTPHSVQSGGPGTQVAKPGIGGNVVIGHHDNPHSPANTVVNRPAGLSGTAMGRSANNPATLGGPAHVASGIGGASIRPRR